jgi:hypothetical protein
MQTDSNRCAFGGFNCNTVEGSWMNIKIGGLDIVLVGGVVLGALFLADWKATHPHQLDWLRSDRSKHLGAEYNSIAQALVAGRGFSDPFRKHTGPTAWMPPILPSMLAAVHWLTNGTEAVAVEFLLSIHGLGVFLAGIILLIEARRLRMRWLGVVILVAACAANFHELFQKTHDSGWLLLLVGILWLGTVRWWNGSPNFWLAGIWGSFGGLCALSSPIVGATWAVLTARRWMVGVKSSSETHLSATCNHRKVDQAKHIQSRRVGSIFPRWLILRWSVRGVWPYTLLAALISIFAVTPWTIRNQLTLGKWIPIKSNGMYELWQSQCLDNQGVLNLSTSRVHPGSGIDEQYQRYAEIGEIAFLEEKGMLARADIVSNPFKYLNRMTNRLFAACIYFTTLRSTESLRGEGWPIFLKRLVFPLPLIGFMLIVALRPLPLEPQVVAAIAIWFLVLLPYVLVSYYDRYAIPVVGMKMLLVLYGIDSIKQATLYRRRCLGNLPVR